MQTVCNENSHSVCRPENIDVHVRQTSQFATVDIRFMLDVFFLSESASLTHGEQIQLANGEPVSLTGMKR